MKIEEIELSTGHIGSKITYIPPHAEAHSQEGTILSWNDSFIFVEFGRGTPHGCRSENLIGGG